MTTARTDEVERIRGIDVSHHQKDITAEGWRKVRAAGMTFAIIRASCGINRDERFENNWGRATDAGLVVGAYHYFELSHDALLQADVFCGVVGDRVGGFLPPTLDAEEKGVRPEALKIWLESVEPALGRKPWIYTCPGWWDQHVGNDATFASHPLWLADWTPPDSPPLPWTDWIMWQTGKGSVPGIPTQVDLDVLNGDRDVLELLRG